ncbi:unnamed protein product, partial [Meganyctiphanes norvegica]
MASPSFPPCSPALKQFQHYLKLANDYDKRDPVVSYWARLYTLQSSLKVDRKSPEARALLTALMDYLEKCKKDNEDNDAISNEVAGQAQVENTAHKLFMWADGEDRASRFNKNVVKVFYTAGLMFDVIEVFGELTEENAAQRKYAKWKATYIHNCLKRGETPRPGPIEDEGLGEEAGAAGGDANAGFSLPPPHHPGTTGGNPDMDSHAAIYGLPSVPSATTNTGMPTLPGYPPQQPGMPNVASSSPPAPVAQAFVPQPYVPPQPVSGLRLDPGQMSKAQKYCKWALSSLDYEDTTTAITNLQKALTLLTTGRDSG